uniref:Uncharacterized protein n=1 Tax=Papilio xuthus TaxID=66420 RepID=I4DLR3_PAPXU|nr:unknown unsecreted protein [Papilio xuthus]
MHLMMQKLSFRSNYLSIYRDQCNTRFFKMILAVQKPNLRFHQNLVKVDLNI